MTMTCADTAAERDAARTIERVRMVFWGTASEETMKGPRAITRAREREETWSSPPSARATQTQHCGAPQRPPTTPGFSGSCPVRRPGQDLCRAATALSAGLGRWAGRAGGPWDYCQIFKALVFVNDDGEPRASACMKITVPVKIVLLGIASGTDAGPTRNPVPGSSIVRSSCTAQPMPGSGTPEPGGTMPLAKP